LTPANAQNSAASSSPVWLAWRTREGDEQLGGAPQAVLAPPVAGDVGGGRVAHAPRERDLDAAGLGGARVGSPAPPNSASRASGDDERWVIGSNGEPPGGHGLGAKLAKIC
jgi:hypothetical protein